MTELFSEDEIERLRHFKRKVAVTMFCRFEGHRRLRAKSHVSILILILFSIVVISLLVMESP